VIYFYPKDMTSGCTRESQDFRDLYSAFRKAGVDIVGVSRDSVKSHDKFTEKEKLPFPLLADEDERLCKLFDVIHEKSLYGRKYLGIERSTFLLDGTGVLRREWRKVKVPGHAEEVLEAAKSL
jgi:peroxiredoxin Q/BCP